MTLDPTDSHEGAGAPSTSECLGCGIAVATGYPRCPKCHAQMPMGTTSASDTRAAQVEGGTSVDAGSNHSWIYAVGGAAVVAALVVFVVSGTGSGESSSHDPEAAAEGALPAAELDDPRAAGPALGSTGAQITRRPAPSPAAEEGPSAAAGVLLGRLDAARMWSTVDVRGTGLAIKSGYCADPIVNQTIDAIAPELAQLGVDTVTCYERHGPEVFERKLSTGGSGSGGDGADLGAN